MDLLWPGFLVLLGLIPLTLAVYIWMQRRRRRYAVRYSSLALVREALPHHSRLRRHLPTALFLLALAGLVLALARPVAIVSVPTGRATIILAMDVSRSMCSDDIPPNRLVAAQKAAMSFVESQKASTQIGVVAFAGFAELILPPTMDAEVLGDAIESLTTGRRTAIGTAILESLDAIAEIDGTVAPVTTGPSPGIEPTPVPRGAYAPSIIVLLTNGASNRGPWPLDAAQQAGIERRPLGSVEGPVVDVHEVDVVEDPPAHFSPVEVADAVGGQVGHFHFKQIPFRAKQVPRNGQPIRMHNERTQVLSIEAYPGDVIHFAKVQQKARSWILDGQFGEKVEGAAIRCGPRE